MVYNTQNYCFFLVRTVDNVQKNSNSEDYNSKFRSRDSAVGVATGYGLDGRGDEFQSW
jgi:hypothetical protein